MPPTVQGGTWTENVLLSILQVALTGDNPYMGVVFDQIGNLYGTTQYGGNAQMCGGGCGTVFELSPPTQPGGQWTHTVLTFQGSFDGQYPGEVVFGPAGALFGTTFSGGTPGVLCHSNLRIKYGCGTVFQLTPPSGRAAAGPRRSSTLFPGFTHDGTGPSSEITFDSQDTLYGTSGGGTTGYGTVFQLTPPNGNGAWKENVLHDFTGGKDGGNPPGTVVVGANGVLYGNASYSRVVNASGVVFQ